MASFKRTVGLSGKFKSLTIVDGNFVDSETSEIINVAEILGKVYGNNTFDLSTTYKSDEDIE